MAHVGAIIAPLNYRWVTSFSFSSSRLERRLIRINLQFQQLLLVISAQVETAINFLASQSFEEAAQALELVEPMAFIFDGVFSSWALRLTDSNKYSSIGLYLILGDACSTGHAANCKILAGAGTCCSCWVLY